MYKINKQLQKTEESKLPSNRKELFFDILKNDFFLVMDLNLLQLLFSLPLLIVYIIFYRMLVSLSEFSFQNVFSLVFYMGLLTIPCYMLRYFGRGASFGVMKKRAFNEGCFVNSEFFKNLKEGKKNLLLGLLVGISSFIAILGSIYFIYHSDNSFAKGLGIGICILQFFIVECSAQHFLASSCYYELTFSATMKNGFSLAMSNIFISLLYFLVCVALPVFLIFLSTLSAILTTAICFLTLDAITVLFSTLYSHSLFDKYINMQNYPELVNKGLNKEKNV